MKHFGLFLLVLYGCTPAPRPDSDPAVPRSAVAMKLNIDYAEVRVGHSILFSVQGNRLFKISAVEQSGTELWIEEKFPPRPPVSSRPWIRKSLVGSSGNAREIWVGEPGGRPARLWPRPESEAAPKKLHAAAAKLRVVGVRPDTTLAGGEVYPCTRITSTLQIGTAKPLVIVDWCSPEVPFPLRYPDGKSYGGLVRRVVEDPEASQSFQMEVFSSSENARAEMEIPRSPR